jgi:CRP-like cAMP-binding protein
MELLFNVLKEIISISDNEVSFIKNLFHARSIKKGDLVINAGELGRYIAFIETGLVRYYVDIDGAEKTLCFNKEGEFVCGYVSSLPYGPSNVNVQAIEDTEVYQISVEDINQFYKQVPDGEKFGRIVIERVLASVTNQVVSLYCDAPDVRYLKFLSIYPELVRRIPQYYIASYVGVQAPSLSRIRRRLVSKS